MKFVTSKHLKYLRNTLESKHGFSHEELYAECRRRRDWKRRRYKSLKQGTSFFNNVVCILDTTCKCMNEYEWFVKLDLMKIPHEIADFVVAYCWMNPCRWFSIDWRFLNNKKYCRYKYKIPSGYEEAMTVWKTINNRFKKIVKKHLPICSVDDFINYDI